LLHWLVVIKYNDQFNARPRSSLSWLQAGIRSLAHQFESRSKLTSDREVSLVSYAAAYCGLSNAFGPRLKLVDPKISHPQPTATMAVTNTTDSVQLAVNRVERTRLNR